MQIQINSDKLDELIETADSISVLASSIRKLRSKLKEDPELKSAIHQIVDLNGHKKVEPGMVLGICAGTESDEPEEYDVNVEYDDESEPVDVSKFKTPNEIGKELGISGRKVNEILEDLGLQKRLRIDYQTCYKIFWVPNVIKENQGQYLFTNAVRTVNWNIDYVRPLVDYVIKLDKRIGDKQMARHMAGLDHKMNMIPGQGKG